MLLYTCYYTHVILSLRHVAHMRKITNALKLQSKILKGGNCLGDTQVDGRIILRHIKDMVGWLVGW
jgi:hypothetical protein